LYLYLNLLVILPVLLLALHCCVASCDGHLGRFRLGFGLVLIRFVPVILRFECLGIVTFVICFRHTFQSLPEFQKLKFVVQIPDQELSMAQHTYFQLALIATSHL